MEILFRLASFLDPHLEEDDYDADTHADVASSPDMTHHRARPFVPLDGPVPEELPSKRRNSFRRLSSHGGGAQGGEGDGGDDTKSVISVIRNLRENYEEAHTPLSRSPSGREREFPSSNSLGHSRSRTELAVGGGGGGPDERVPAALPPLSHRSGTGGGGGGGGGGGVRAPPSSSSPDGLSSSSSSVELSSVSEGAKKRSGEVVKRREVRRVSDMSELVSSSVGGTSVAAHTHATKEDDSTHLVTFAEEDEGGERRGSHGGGEGEIGGGGGGEKEEGSKRGSGGDGAATGGDGGGGGGGRKEAPSMRGEATSQSRSPFPTLPPLDVSKPPLTTVHHDGPLRHTKPELVRQTTAEKDALHLRETFVFDCLGLWWSELSVILMALAIAIPSIILMVYYLYGYRGHLIFVRDRRLWTKDDWIKYWFGSNIILVWIFSLPQVVVFVVYPKVRRRTQALVFCSFCGAAMIWNIVHSFVAVSFLVQQGLYFVLWIGMDVVLCYTTGSHFHHVFHTFIGIGFPTIVTAVAVFLYDFLILPLFFSTANNVARGAIRLVLHPIFWSLTLFVSRMLGKRAPGAAPNTHFCILLFPLFCGAFYGRLLTTSFDSLGSMTITTLISATIEIVIRLTMAKRDALISRLLFGRSHTKQHFSNNAVSIALYVEFLYIEMVYELASVIITVIVVLLHQQFYDVTIDSRPVGIVVASLFIQLAIELAADLISLWFEMGALRLPMSTMWEIRPQMYHFTLIFVYLGGFAYIIENLLLILYGEYNTNK